VIYQKRGDLVKAMNYFEMSLELNENINGKDNYETSKTLKNIGLVYRQ